VPPENNNYRAQVNVSYELDLWGKLRNSAQAAQAELLATTAARETVRIALTTSVVHSYYALIALDAQVDATRRSLALRQHDFRLQRVRADAGLINDFALRQLEAEVAAAQAQLPVLESRRSSEELALGVLLALAVDDGEALKETELEALAAAVDVGDYAPFEKLLTVLQQPFEEKTEFSAYADPAPASESAGYQTFCGT
jgi:multidrug efflux system outer membrane protein